MLDYEVMDILQLSCKIFTEILGWKKEGKGLYFAPGVKDRSDGKIKHDWFDTGNPLTYCQMPADSLDACREAEKVIKEKGLAGPYVRLLHTRSEGLNYLEKDISICYTTARDRCVAMLLVLRRKQ